MIEEVLIFGAIQGAVFALLALGFSLVYGVGGVLNLAHGAFYLIAAYALLWFVPAVGLQSAMILALVVALLVGAISYLLLIKPLQKTHIGVVIATFALAVFMEQFVKVIESARTGGVVTPTTVGMLVNGSVEFLGVKFLAQDVVAFVGSMLLVSLVTVFMWKAKVGKSIRAVAEDRETATLMGINADRILLLTVMLSSLLAGAAAVLYVPASALYPPMGWSILLVAFSVVVLGGMGSIPGSIIGAFVIAYARNFCTFFIDPALAELVPLIVIFLVLVFRPQGLLGKKEVQ
ncbi:MAG: branched-chain amino acid ABC transporter permease [Candidatus Atabeyarchaeum deiterrae]